MPRSSPSCWQISSASAGLALPVKILMRSGFIARTGFGRTGFGEAIGYLWNGDVALVSMRSGIARDSKTRWGTLLYPETTFERDTAGQGPRKFRRPRNHCLSSRQVLRRD